MSVYNQLCPAKGATKNRRRVCRGMGSGLGKTGGRGHKGQKSRSGGKVAVGFEGGQNPMYKRLPKRGFISRKSFYSAQIRLSELNIIKEVNVTIEVLKSNGLINKHVLHAKVFLSGKITKAVNLVGIKASAGALKAIEKAGGKVS